MLKSIRVGWRNDDNLHDELQGRNKHRSERRMEKYEDGNRFQEVLSKKQWHYKSLRHQY